jgi:hypothetical protein
MLTRRAAQPKAVSRITCLHFVSIQWNRLTN